MTRRLQYGRRSVVPAIALAFGAVACDPSAGRDQRDDAPAQDPAVILRDSAGVQIVENLTSEWDSAAFWSVEPEPEFAIGGYGGHDPGDASHLVWAIRTAGLLSDGRVVMLSPNGENKVLIFEPSGALSASFGRQGEGPGEFRYPMDLQVPVVHRPVERVMWIGADFVIGTDFRPELGVQSVKGYRLHRNAGRF